MLWVVRAGKDSIFYEKFLKEEKIFIPWQGYFLDLNQMKTLDSLKKIVRNEKNTDNCISILNWSAQLNSFVNEMYIGDYVLIPAKGSKSYAFAKISGDYEFLPDERDRLYHCRSIQVLKTNISRNIFAQKIIYSLGTFRTIFKTHYENEILETIQKIDRYKYYSKGL